MLGNLDVSVRKVYRGELFRCLKKFKGSRMDLRSFHVKRLGGLYRTVFVLHSIYSWEVRMLCSLNQMEC